jgi:hypothetical protein
MSWLVEWKAIADRISGMLDAARFCLETRSDDPYGVAEKHLLPQAQGVFTSIQLFSKSYGSSLPEIAAECLAEFLEKSGQYFTSKDQEPRLALQFRVTTLVSFRAEFSYLLTDTAAFARRLSERAFMHIQRCIVADTHERERWKDSFNQGEAACEKLGAARLLLHGIWAFKVNAEGERTDIVFSEPICNREEVEQSADALVLTEWKIVKSGTELQNKLALAKNQASRYSTGVLAGLELARYRYLVVVSGKVLRMPADDHDGNLIYRHINISVDPDTPSRG